MRTLLQDYYEYTQWANDRTLNAAEKLSPEQFLQPALPELWSIRDTIAHIMISQWAWVERWNGRTPSSYPKPNEFSDIASIRSFWTTTYDAMRDVLQRFDEQQLAADFSYTNAKGETWSYPLWEELMQVANHSTYHRGEVAALLTSFGHSPGELDWLVWRDWQQRHNASR